MKSLSISNKKLMAVKLILLAAERIEYIKTLPYYNIFAKTGELERDIKKKKELIEWIKHRWLFSKLSQTSEV